MTQPSARDIAREIRVQLRDCRVSWAHAAAVAGITERQLRRRLEYGTPFKAHEVAVIQELLDNAYAEAA